MGWLGKKPDAYEMSDDPQELLQQLGRRKHWKKMSPKILRRIFQNSQDSVFQDPKCDVEVLKHFICISEQTVLLERSLLRANLLPIATQRAADVDEALALFSLTFYRLARRYINACYLSRDEEEVGSLVVFADMALSASIVCDLFNLASYACMALLYRTIWTNKEAALEWCGKYRQAEDRLLKTPDSELSNWALAQKEGILKPTQYPDIMRTVAEHAPDLLPPDMEEDGPTMREMIDRIEQELTCG